MFVLVAEDCDEFALPEGGVGFVVADGRFYGSHFFVTPDGKPREVMGTRTESVNPCKCRLKALLAAAMKILEE